MKREQLSDDGLKRTVWTFIARDQIVTLAAVAVDPNEWPEDLRAQQLAWRKSS